MNVTFLKWSRFLHKWLGIYIAVFTLLWVSELLILPSFYNAKPLASFTEQYDSEPSIQKIIHAVNAGEYGTPAKVEVSYQPDTQHYLIKNKENYTVLTIDALTGQPLSNETDYDALLTKKSGLGWINESLGDFLKIPFQIFFVILSVTGLHLILFPHMKKKRASQGILALKRGQEFIYKSTTSSKDMAKTASIGLLPGVRVTLLYIPRRGPVVLSARNTRIAVARSVAKSFIISPVEV